MSTNNDVTPSAAAEHLLGRVKWFNNKAGYGFITVTDGKRSGSDVFVHHSAVNVENNQYKYLVQGEYVEFDLIKTQSEKHEWQASNVSGIKGGKLMCETRHELKVARNEYKLVPKSDEPQMPKQRGEPRQRAQPRETVERKTGAPRARGEGPRDGDNKKEWTLVSKNKKEGTIPKPKPRAGKPAQEETK
jgi:CspA family cold shock protein